MNHNYLPWGLFEEDKRRWYLKRKFIQKIWQDDSSKKKDMARRSIELSRFLNLRNLASWTKVVIRWVKFSFSLLVSWKSYFSNQTQFIIRYCLLSVSHRCNYKVLLNLHIEVTLHVINGLIDLLLFSWILTNRGRVFMSIPRIVKSQRHYQPRGNGKTVK